MKIGELLSFVFLPSNTSRYAVFTIYNTNGYRQTGITSDAPVDVGIFGVQHGHEPADAGKDFDHG